LLPKDEHVLRRGVLPEGHDLRERHELGRRHLLPRGACSADAGGKGVLPVGLLRQRRHLLSDRTRLLRL
jgi:hypothetical protein